MLIGVNYHPEHWPPERWREDARLMRESGFNAVRIGEYAWSHLEPVRNKYRFRWIEDVIGVFADNGVRSVLCTPTAAPPPWLVERHPSIPPTDASGQRLAFGTRRAYCPNNPSYHKYGQRITAALAGHLRSHRSIIAWQIDSGFGRFGTARCYCRNCAQGFREWLQRKYESLETLNRRWGTVHWSQQYSDWQQVPLPWRAVGDGELAHNPSLSLDYKRFCSDSWAAFQRLLIEAVRGACPGVPVTHNLAASVTEVDCFRLARDLDFVTASLSDGPRGYGPDTRLFLDMMYAVKGKRFWVSELDDALTASGMADSLTWSQQIVPFAYSAVARGAEGLFFSRWRPAPFGADQLRSGLLNHDGAPTRGLEAAARLARSLTKGHEDALRGSQESEVALLVCHESAWALDDKPDPNIAYWDHVSTVHSALSQHTPGLSIIGPTSRFAPYKVIVAPALYLLRDETAKALREYVKGGGHLVLTCMSGTKDADNNVWTTGLPGGMREALGAVVKGFGRILDGETRKLRLAATERAFAIRDWNDLIELQGAKALALYAEGPLKGLPAATVNSFGPGRAYYIGAYAEAEFYHSLLETVCREAQVTPRPQAAPGVEIIARGGVTFVLNRSFESKTVSLDGLYEDARRGSKYRGQIELLPDGAFVLKKIG